MMTNCKECKAFMSSKLIPREDRGVIYYEWHCQVCGSVHPFEIKNKQGHIIGRYVGGNNNVR